MTHATPERIADEERERWEAGAEDEGSRAASELDGTRPTAEQFHITDMQHWIDLSA